MRSQEGIKRQYLSAWGVSPFYLLTSYAPHIMATAQQSEGHRVYLRDLIHKERTRSYRRHDYLSRDWQIALWKNEVQQKQQQQLVSSSSSSSSQLSSSCLGVDSTPDARRSPSSVIVTGMELSYNSPSSLSPGASEVCPSGDLSSTYISNISETQSQLSSASGICIRWREKITDWKYQVVDQFGRYYLECTYRSSSVHNTSISLFSVSCLCTNNAALPNTPFPRFLLHTIYTHRSKP